MWTDAQRKVFARILANVKSREAAIAKLRELMPYMPQYAQQIRDIVVREENLRQLATTAIASDSGSEESK